MATRQKTKRKVSPSKVTAPAKASDQAIYLVIGVIGLFWVIIATLFFVEDMRYWLLFSTIYVALIGYLTNVYTFQIYRGKHLANWQQALARLPLRFVGYGTKDGKPLDAAHDHPETRTALFVCMLLTVAVLAGLTFVSLRMIQ